MQRQAKTQFSVISLFLLENLLAQSHKVLSVLVLQHGLCHFTQFLRADPTLTVGDTFQAGHFQPLPLLDDFDESRGFGEAVVCASVQPGESPSEGFYFQFPFIQVDLVHRGDFQFAPGRWFDMCRYVHHTVGVEIQAHHGIVALRQSRFSSMLRQLPALSNSATP